METHPVIVIRELYSHLSRYHDNGDAAAAIRRHHVVEIYTSQPDRIDRLQV